MHPSPPAHAPPALTVTLGSRSRTLTPGAVLRIGRGLDCDLVSTDTRVSRLHAEIGWREGVWVYRNHGGNGSFAGRQHVAELALTGAIELRLGNPDDGEALRIEPAGATGAAGDVGAPDAATITAARTPASRPAPRSMTHDPPTQYHQAASHHGSGLADGVVATIGRALDNDVVLSDIQASRHHARVVAAQGRLFVEDLRSMNGTQLGGASISRAPLGPEDVITIGSTRLRMEGRTLVPVAPGTGDLSLVARHVSFTLPSGKTLLDDVGFVVPPSSLVAVIGPSGAGKSTLLRALTGSQPATSGSVHFDARDMYRDHAEMRQRVGLVPQEDVVHRQLTVRQALRYAAELRFPHDLERAARLARVEEVLAELSLTEHSTTRIDRLSGGQRKRVSVALELLTRPSLLFLDEPTSGLDPGLDKQVMTTLRTLADGGRTVVVVTHSVDNLDQCDRVLLLAPGGKVAYYGPPGELLGHFGRDRYADVFVDVAADPDGVAHRFGSSAGGARSASDLAARPADAAPPRPPDRAPTQQRRRQFTTLVRRHLRVILADRSYALSMLLLPAVLAVLTWVVPGEHGLASPPPGGLPTGEPRQVLVILLIGAAFMGMSASIRELVGERAIFARESAVGLTPDVYLVGKLVVFAGVVALQSVVLVTLVTLRKTPPEFSALLGSGRLELVIACAACAFAAAALGLLASALVTTSEQVMPLLVIAVMTQLVLCGGLFPVNDRAVLEQISWLAPSRWGFAAAAATVDLGAISAGEVDPLWSASAGSWLRSLSLLGVLSAGFAAAAYGLLRRRAKR